MDQHSEQEQTLIVAGRNAVTELLKSGRPVDTLYLRRGEQGGTAAKLAAMAKQAGAVVKQVDDKKLDALAGNVNHQGVAAAAAAAQYATVEQILERAEERGEQPFLILADEIEDPHNLGAIIRTAEAAGAHGVLIPKRRSASLTAAVYKASAGALSHMPVARVSNLVAAMEELKKRGIWMYAADMDGQPWCGISYDGGVGVVIGSEGRGVTRLVKQTCDFVVSLPMLGKVNSLNASVAGGILMYEVARQRLGQNAVNK